MNRNSKHPDRPSHRRKPSGSTDHRNGNAYRITASWNRRPDRPFVKVTPDRKAARRIAREMAEQGAYVIAERHQGSGQWETWFELDGPALAREQRAAEAERRRVEEEQRRQAEAARRAAVDEAQRRQAAARRQAAERASLERLMSRPPVMRDSTGRVTARHTSGG
ncbi:hypothetical protein [Streptomyces nigra]|uniref:hypothetical protein n=1 Tax=Streptomyces nigra TaxID=1827580 RepID=UPI00383049EB